MYHIFKCLILICVVLHAFAWKNFHRGRSVGGNLGDPISQKNNTTPSEDKWFVQTLDHFNPSDDRVWKQRYFVNNEFYNGSDEGPVFLMIGGEGEASAKWMIEGQWIEYAKEFGALCFQLEHRYYGKSHPTPDLGTKNLQYLNSEQALADIAAFVEAMNDEFSFGPYVKWIAFGGSYPGSLAAWVRAKYPHLITGSMSASGPLLAKADFFEYYRVVEDALRTYSDDCVKAVQQGTNQIDILLRHMIGQKNLNKKFNLCDPIEKSVKNEFDISNFYETLAGNFAGIVQYNKDNRQGKSAKTANITIDTLCDIMTNSTIGPEVDRLASVNNLLLNATGEKCLDYKYDNMILEYRNISLDSEVAEGGRQWMYQTCTEFGFYQTSAYQPPIFGNKFPLEFFVKQCEDIFGPRYNEDFIEHSVDRTNMFYGALNIEVSNVVFVHGSIDPWHALGITKTVDNKAPAIYIKGTAHCANMYPKSDRDLPQLNAARIMVGQLIDTWIRLG